MYEYLACVFGDQEPEEYIKYPGTEVIDGYVLPSGSGNHTGPLQEQRVPLTSWAIYPDPHKDM